MGMDALSKFRTLVANTAQWQTITGAANATAALDYIHYFGLKPDHEGGSALPSAPQMYIRNASSTRPRVAESTYDCRGRINALVELPRPAVSTWELEYSSVYTSLDTLRDQMLTLSGTAGYLIIGDFTITGPKLSSENDSRAVWVAEFDIRWPDR